MNYELRLPHDTQNDIREYINERFTELADQHAALTAILQELDKLAVNPALGTLHYGGPFETRPVYRFSIVVGGVTWTIQVAYAVHKQDRVVVVTGFVPIAPVL